MGFFVTLLIYAVIFVLSELLRPKPELENAKAAGLGDFQFPTAQEDRAVPVIFGTVRQKGPNVVWYGDYRQDPLTEEVKTGLFSSEDIVVGYKYFLGVQFALCRGPVDSLERLWIGDTEIPVSEFPVTNEETFEIDCPNLFGGDDLGQGGVSGVLKFFAGTQTQAISDYLIPFQSVSGQTPRYVNTCYVVPLADPIYLGNSTSIKPWAFELKRIPDPLSLGGDATVNGFDANPANVLYELLTNKQYGLGIDPSLIDSTSFATAGATLADEGNGFSYIWDRIQKISQVLRLVEEQIDGVIFFASNGKYKINLARDDYDIDLVPQVTESSGLMEVEDFTRGSWSDTTNEVRVSFVSRSDTYKGTYAVAQDLANIRVQQGQTVSVTQSFPGCMDATLANFLAWRKLRTLSYPLARAKLTLNRNFSDLEPGQVIAFSSTQFGLTKLPMRVQRIDTGILDDGKVRVDVIQDVFTADVGSFGDPPDGGWEPPSDTLTAYPTDQQIAFESPRAFAVRAGALLDKVWCGARRQGPEVGFRMVERNDPVNPTGAFDPAGSSFGLLRIGELVNSLPAGSATPTATVLVDATPDTQAAIETAFTDSTDPSDLGIELVNLVWIGTDGQDPDGEFALVTSAQNSGGDVQLNNVYRGVLDTSQRTHPSGTPVWLLFVGGNLTTSVIPQTNFVDIKLLPFSQTDELSEASATAIELQMANRIRRPIPPAAIKLENVNWKTSTSLDVGADADVDGIDLDLIRRDYRTINEVDALTIDAQTLDSTFPTANNTTHEVDVRNDPAGTNTLLFTQILTGIGATVLRNAILRFTNGVLPTTMRFDIRANHDDASVNFDSLLATRWDFSVTTALTGQFNFGALDTAAGGAGGGVSFLYTATVNGTYNFTLVNALGNNVQYRLNGGAWTNLITTGNTAGSIAGVVATDTIEVRHLDTGLSGTDYHFLAMDAPGAGQDGYAVLY